MVREGHVEMRGDLAKDVDTQRIAAGDMESLHARIEAAEAHEPRMLVGPKNMARLPQGM